MALRHVAAATVLALAGTLLATGPAAAQRPEQVRRTHSINIDVPAGAEVNASSPALGNAKQATVKVLTRAEATGAEESIFENFTHALGKMTKAKRLLACVLLHNYAGGGGRDPYEANYEVTYASGALAMLVACLRLAGLLESSGPPSARLQAGGPCGRNDIGVPARIRKTDGGYTVSVDGTTRKAKKTNPLKVVCKRKPNGVVYTVRARKKGVPLRKVVGPNLRIGMKSPSDAESSVPVRITFSAR